MTRDRWVERALRAGKGKTDAFLCRVVGTSPMDGEGNFPDFDVARALCWVGDGNPGVGLDALFHMSRGRAS